MAGKGDDRGTIIRMEGWEGGWDGWMEVKVGLLRKKGKLFMGLILGTAKVSKTITLLNQSNSSKVTQIVGV